MDFATSAARILHTCRPRDSFLFPGETTEDGCNLLPRAWFPSLVDAEYSPASIDEMFAMCDANSDGGVTWAELRTCFEADEGDIKRWMLRELHRCYDQVYANSIFDEKLDEFEFAAMVDHQSSLWELAHEGDACALAFLAYDGNGDLLLQFQESKRWILDYGDVATGATNRQKKAWHRNWWAGADQHEPELDDNDLTWHEFSQACPGVPVTGSPDPPVEPEQPEQPEQPKTPAELAAVSQAILDENTIPSYEWTAYIYGTILPHIEELHDAGLLYWVEEDDVDVDYTFRGYRNTQTQEREGWGCAIRKTSTDNSDKWCWHRIGGVKMGLHLRHWYTTAFHIGEWKNDTDYGKSSRVDIDGAGAIVWTGNFLHTQTSPELGDFEEHLDPVALDRAYYTVVGPSGNLYDDSLAGEIAIAPLRALDTPWQAGICEPGETPTRDDDGLCAAYLASLNP